ncbi:DUF1996 domain-containing protein [Dactylosporangium sp. CA-092794]|uniref:DUF1996 domain-containing protein n=1 Tax=Dactylosporangium sp. CA-092794 TaxID=3239929 RepID=UPI003D8C4856
MSETPLSRPARVRRFARRHPALATTLGAVTAAAAIAVGVPLAEAATGDPVPANAIRAAGFAEQSGARTENTGDAGGGKNVGWLADGDWLRYDGVDLGPAGTLATSVRVAAAYRDRTGTVEVHTGSATGPLVGSLPVTSTGGWQAWQTRTTAGTSPGGRQDVFLVIRSPQPNDFVNINWFAFAAGGSAAPRTASAPAPASSGTGPSPTASVPAASTPPAAPAGWLDVDPAAWQAQLAAFDATAVQPAPAGKGRNPEFNATCAFSHAKPDDPIVFPGLAGASHRHSFVGNDRTDASTTFDDLMRFTASSCAPVEDHSAYWVPTLSVDGKAVEPDQFIVYYGSLMADTTKTVPMPNGLRMVQGDAKRQQPTPVGAVNQFYCAGGPQDGAGRSADGNFPICSGGTVHFTLRFPDCWDGKHLDSPNHKDHVTFGQNNTCPASHPVRIPAVTFSIAYPTAGGADMKLSSGLASSMHGDAFFAWETAAMNQRVKNCVIQAVACRTNGGF